MKYAMVLKGRVIGILSGQTEVPHWPPDNKGNQITAIPCKADAVVNLGMVYDDVTGKFVPYSPKARALTVPEQILNIVSKSKEEIENAAIDAFTEELIEGGML